MQQLLLAGGEKQIDMTHSLKTQNYENKNHLMTAPTVFMSAMSFFSNNESARNTDVTKFTVAPIVCILLDNRGK